MSQEPNASASLLHALRDAFSAPETIQGAFLVFVLLVLGLWTTWPRAPEEANQSWYGLASLRAGALAAWGLLAGARDAARAGRLALPTVLAMLVVALLTSPVELAAHAATAPARGLGWSLATTPLLLTACYGLGAAVSGAAARARLAALVPLLLPAVVVGIVYLDVRFEIGAATPWLLPHTPSTASFVLLASAAGLTLLLASRAWRGGPVRREARA